MRRKEFEASCKEEAKKLLTPEDYNALVYSMNFSTLVLFDYLCDRQFSEGRCQGEKTAGPGIWLTYRRVLQKDFICSQVEGEEKPRIYIWAYHELHGTKETFRAEAIKNVRDAGNVIVALLDMQKYKTWWDGSALSYETTTLQVTTNK